MKKVLSRIFFPFVNEKYQLENKWWHRLIKVIFIIVMIVSFIWMLFWFWIFDKTNDLFSYNENLNIKEYEDLLQQYLKDPKQDNESKKQIFQALQDWEKPEDLINYLETSWYKLLTQTRQMKPWFLDLWKDIWLLILFLFFINIWLQFIYYNMFLYIMYWKK